MNEVQNCDQYASNSKQIVIAIIDMVTTTINIIMLSCWWQWCAVNQRVKRFHLLFSVVKSSSDIAWLSLNFILSKSWVALYSVVCQASVSFDQISTFSDIYRHKSPILTLYQIIRVTHSILGLFLTSFQGRQEISWRKERQRRRRGEAQDEHSCQVFHFHNERAHSQDG